MIDVQGVQACRDAQFMDLILCSIQLQVTPWGNFLCEQKVTKESHRERVFRLPLSLCTLTHNDKSGLRPPFDTPGAGAVFDIADIIFC